MSLGTAVAYAIENPDRLPNDRGDHQCGSCGRRFHRAHETCPACDEPLADVKRRLTA